VNVGRIIAVLLGFVFAVIGMAGAVTGKVRTSAWVYF
jgi:hypothetical protein